MDVVSAGADISGPTSLSTPQLVSLPSRSVFSPIQMKPLLPSLLVWSVVRPGPLLTAPSPLVPPTWTLCSPRRHCDWLHSWNRKLRLHQGGESGTSDDAVINVSEALSGASFEVTTMSSTLVSKTDHQSFSNLQTLHLRKFFAFQTPKTTAHPRRRIRYSMMPLSTSRALSGASFEVANDYEFYVASKTDHQSFSNLQTLHLRVFFAFQTPKTTCPSKAENPVPLMMPLSTSRSTLRSILRSC